MVTENKHVVKQWYEKEDAVIEALVTPEIVETFIGIAGISRDDDSLNATKLALTEALKSFKWGWFNQDDLHTESFENKALEDAAKNAARLDHDLLILQDYPGVEARLEATIKNNGRLYKLNDGKTLSDLISTNHNIFFAYRQLLQDLRFCLEKTSNRKPKRSTFDGFETEQEFTNRMKEWRVRSKARALPRDHALHEFIKALRPFWEENSVHPFTEGMYFKEANQTISNLVDVVECVMAVAFPSTTRSQIVTAIREVRTPSS